MLVAMVGLLVTAALWRDAAMRAAAVAEARFEYRTDRIHKELAHRLDSYETALKSIAGFIGVREGFDRGQWRRYFERAPVIEEYPGRLLIGYAPRVPLNERSAHEDEVRRDGLAGYKVTSIGGAHRGAYSPLAFIDRALPAGTVTLGEDLADDPVAAEAMSLAARTGRTIMSGPLRWSRSQSEADQVWGIFVPVYGGDDKLVSEADRKRALMGFVVEAFHPMETVGSSLGADAKLIGLRARDGAVPLFTCPEMTQEVSRGFKPMLVRDIPLRYGERQWTMHFVALPGYLATVESDQPSIVLVAGSLVSLLLGGLVGTMAYLRARAVNLVAERTVELQAALARSEASESRTRAVVDNALDAIITIDERGAIQSFNPSAERLFGYTQAEVMGRNVHLLMPSPDREQHDGYMQHYLATGERRIIGIGREVTGQRKDGSCFPLDLGVSSMQIGGVQFFSGIVRDITGRRLAEQALQQSERKLRSYIEQSLDGVIVVDGDGRYLEVNPAASGLLGRSPSDLLRMTIGETLAPDPTNVHAGTEHFRRVVETGRSQGEVVLLRPDGTYCTADIAAVALGNGRYLGILRDVTERHQASLALQRERELLEVRVAERTEVLTRTNAALQQEVAERRRVEGELVAAREQALQAAEAKAGFLANMSHEIRTPMNAVVGMTALLEETSLNAEQRDYVQTIRTSGDALLAVINDILDFSKVDSGMLELEHRPFELGACIEEAVEMLAPRAAEKGIDLLYVLADDVPPWIVGDATRLRQVFVNLLSNAVKFTERGEVCLSAGLIDRNDHHLRLQFSIRDTGIGIPADQQHQLFKAFSQADSSTTRKYGGTGLGLAICQRLVRLMGGVIGLESADGQGSTFFFTIAAEAASGTHRPRYASQASPELTGKRVLLVDDNPTNLHILETQCRRWGMEVSSASSATEALTMLDKDRLFDAAVLDLHMPGMDGVQLAQQIRWLCPGSLPALLLLSSSTHRRGSAPAEGLFAARLAKPVKHTQLFESLTRVLQADAGHEGPIDSSRRLDPTMGQRLPLRILVAEDSAINQKLAVGILAKLGYACDVAGNGAEALELVKLRPYDLVFMDLQMPEMDGLESTRRIVAEMPPLDRPRIVAMTANALTGDRERCLEAGMDDYIAKPILPVDVQALIERTVGSGRKAALVTEPDSVPLIDQRIVGELRAIDEPGQPSLLRSLLLDYLAETPGTIGEIKRFADRREASRLAQKAHKLAGISASLGATGMSEVCVRMERHIAAGDLTGLASMIDQLELRFARTRAEFQRLV
ncbi:PAS domain S-box protein [Ideonella sp. A 288]|uniref:PAS domain S-box protein n=1 Tax=Ideonella sp. A 288 TaxID=1962181 RepID=UPI001303620D|nr:PAS domain S-box protein [Ideonella sp. A 288]